MAHTPGPWYRSGPLAEDECGIAGGVDVDVVAPAPNDEPPCTISILDGLSVDDADLIAAAPDLLAALKAIVAMLQKEAPGTKLNGRAFDQLGIDAHNAIAKAEGRS